MLASAIAIPTATMTCLFEGAAYEMRLARAAELLPYEP